MKPLPTVIFSATWESLIQVDSSKAFLASDSVIVENLFYITRLVMRILRLFMQVLSFTFFFKNLLFWEYKMTEGSEYTVQYLRHLIT